MKLHAHLKVNAAIPIDSDVTTGLYLLRTHRIPNQAATLRYHARELGRACLASDDREWNTGESQELDGVGGPHENRHIRGRVIHSSPTRPVVADRHDRAAKDVTDRMMGRSRKY